MNIMPRGNIKLIESPFNKYADSNKLKWVTQLPQTEYFNNITGLTLTKLQYSIISNGIIRIDRTYNTLKDYNYLIFSDDTYYNKKFYCFIKNIREISAGVCYIYIAIDEAQTWFFDGSKNKYLSKAPTSEIKSIYPQTVEVIQGGTVNFTAFFSDDKHSSSLAEFYHGFSVEGIDISIDGKLTVDLSVPLGTTYVVLARDKYDITSTATANITIV